MSLIALLAAIAEASSALSGVFPPAAIVGIGAGIAGTVIGAIRSGGTIVVDEDGNPVPLEELEARVVATWDKAAVLSQQGSDTAQGELDRTDGE